MRHRLVQTAVNTVVPCILCIVHPQHKINGSDPAHYRPILLLSVMYKLLERLILQHIETPLIETATSVHQAGFRKHCSCTEQVIE
jgi:hypothetical protein